MKWFLRLFGYVKKLEEDLETARKRIVSDEHLTASLERYIFSLEEWKKFNEPRMITMEVQNSKLREEIAELKKHLSGGK